MPDLDSLLGLKGRNVLITGAAGGIGQSMVRQFLRAGARVSGADRDSKTLQHLALEHAYGFDLCDRNATRLAVHELASRGATPDILICNAGYTRGELLGDIDDATWDNELAINLTGVANLVGPVMDQMMRKGGGAIVFISSVNALSHFGNPAYAAAKAGLIAYAKAIAVERGERGIRANVICPGSVMTPAWQHRLQRDPQLLDRVLPHYPLGRLVTPEEVSKAALFLASNLASGITGSVLSVDAGLTAGNLSFIRGVLGSD